MGSVILGSIRLRQLRVEKNMGCEVSRGAGKTAPHFTRLSEN